MINTQETVKALNETTDVEQRTKIFTDWLQAQDDDTKLYFAINWRIPHSIFNVACKFFDGSDIQNIDWYQIYKNKSELTWSHGGKVY